jgi:hypothetical protein
MYLIYNIATYIIFLMYVNLTYNNDRNEYITKCQSSPHNKKCQCPYADIGIFPPLLILSKHYE